MEPTFNLTYVEIGRSYAALRLSGAPPERACAELGCSSEAMRPFERRLAAPKPGEGGDAVRPRFARCGAHIAAVMQQGGFPVLQR